MSQALLFALSNCLFAYAEFTSGLNAGLECSDILLWLDKDMQTTTNFAISSLLLLKISSYSYRGILVYAENCRLDRK